MSSRFGDVLFTMEFAKRSKDGRECQPSATGSSGKHSSAGYQRGRNWKFCCWCSHSQRAGYCAARFCFFSPSPYALQFHFWASLRRPHYASTTEIMANSARENSGSEPPAQFPKFLPVLAEVWISATIIVFFAVRILGSNTFKHFMHSVSH